MNNKAYIYVGILFIVLSVIAIASSFFLNSVFLMIFSIFTLLVSIFLLFGFMTYDLFTSDKKMDVEALKRQGLTIVECQYCHKNNVLEDQYCIYCGEKLGENDE